MRKTLATLILFLALTASASAAPQLSSSRAHRVVQRYERAYWHGYPVKLHFGACRRVKAEVRCPVTVTGVFANVVLTEADGSTKEVPGPAQSITYSDHARLQHGHVAITVSAVASKAELSVAQGRAAIERQFPAYTVSPCRRALDLTVHCVVTGAWEEGAESEGWTVNVTAIARLTPRGIHVSLVGFS